MHIYVRGFYSTDVNVGTVLFTLNEDFRPKRYSLEKPIFGSDITRVLGYITINANGQVVLSKAKLPANEYFLIDTTYFVD